MSCICVCAPSYQQVSIVQRIKIKERERYHIIPCPTRARGICAVINLLGCFFTLRVSQSVGSLSVIASRGDMLLINSSFQRTQSQRILHPIKCHRDNLRASTGRDHAKSVSHAYSRVTNVNKYAVQFCALTSQSRELGSSVMSAIRRLVCASACLRYIQADGTPDNWVFMVDIRVLQAF